MKSLKLSMPEKEGGVTQGDSDKNEQEKKVDQLLKSTIDVKLDQILQRMREELILENKSEDTKVKRMEEKLMIEVAQEGQVSMSNMNIDMNKSPSKDMKCDEAKRDTLEELLEKIQEKLADRIVKLYSEDLL